MKKNVLMIAVALFFSASTALGQDIHQSQVPSVILNNFQQQFPKAKDVEWERSGENYKVEFETHTSIVSSDQDHDVYYNKAGDLLRHVEEVSKKDLPKKILSKIKSEFKGYRIDDADKITEGNEVTYNLELGKGEKEWKVAFDENGKIKGKVVDY